MSEKQAWYTSIKHFCTSFVSLVWLDGSINFVFRFVAKISELLLAIGIVISAADFLTHGRLMQNNVALSDAWAWTQAIAIESSSGVVLLYALQARKEQDAVKAWLYACLAFLLATVGGFMLLTQIVYSTTGIDIVLSAPKPTIVAVDVLRMIVSIAYIAMCRIKHVRLSGNEPTNAPAIDIQSEVQNALANVAQNLQDMQEQWQQMQQQQMQVVMQEVKRTVIEEVTQAKLIAMPKQQNVPALPAPQPTNNEQNALDALHTNPAISNVDLAKLLGYKDARSAKTWRQKQVIS